MRNKLGTIPVRDLRAKIMSPEEFKRQSRLGLLKWRFAKPQNKDDQLRALIESIESLEEDVEILRKDKPKRGRGWKDIEKGLSQTQNWINIQKQQIELILIQLGVIKLKTPEEIKAEKEKGPAFEPTLVQKAKEYLAQREALARQIEETRKAVEKAKKDAEIAQKLSEEAKKYPETLLKEAEQDKEPKIKNLPEGEKKKDILPPNK